MLPPVTPVAFCQVLYDVLIVGGGTAGLTLAERLSQNPAITVGVIEAGLEQFDNPLVNIPGLYGRAVGSDIDWNFQTEPLEALDGLVVHEARGKMLGGSSGLNYLLWNRAGKQDYDDWEELGNPGWGWDTVFNSSLEAEHFEAPITATQLEHLPSPPFVPAFHQSRGAVSNSFPKFYPEPVKSFFPTAEALGIPQNKDPMGGNNLGLYVSLAAIEEFNATRSYSATAFLRPNLRRKNLVVLSGAQATRVRLSSSEGGRKKATAVNFNVNGTTYEARARKEIVLSAGSFQTPQLLQLSGIGDCAVLKHTGIECIVENPRVGKNLQDHVIATNVYQFQPGITTIDLFDNATLLAEFTAEYNANRTGPLSSGGAVFGMIPLSSFMSEDELRTVQSLANRTSSESAITPLLRQHLLNSSIPHIELLFSTRRSVGTPAPGATYLSLSAGLMHPFSSGTVHINTSDPLAKPVISANWYTEEVDRKAMLEATKFLDEIANTQPLKQFLLARINPAPSDRPLTDSQWWKHIRNTTGTTFHPVGTSAMLPKDLGGVVDTSLRVYGVDGLRVVDASIIPKQIATHPQSTVYAIAERAAAIIKREWERDGI